MAAPSRRQHKPVGHSTEKTRMECDDDDDGAPPPTKRLKYGGEEEDDDEEPPLYDPPPSPLFGERDDSLSYLERRFAADKRHQQEEHERNTQLVFDDSMDPETQEPRHDYSMRGSDGRRLESVTTALGHFMSPFDEEQTITRIEQALQGTDYYGEYKGCHTREQIRLKMRSAAVRGTEYHYAFEALLLGQRLTPAQRKTLEDAGGFRRAMADHPNLRVVFIEGRFYLESIGIAGKSDAAMFDTEERILIIVDWKNGKYGSIPNIWQCPPPYFQRLAFLSFSRRR
jgi:hypothetical protein